MPAQRLAFSQRVLLFDLSEVLVGGLFGVVPVLAERLALAETEILSGLGEDSWLALMEGRCTEERYWRSVLDETGWPLSPEELGRFAREAFGRIVPGMPGLVARLRSYRLAMLSDHCREWMSFIDQAHPFLAPVRERFLSFEMGQTKRQRSTFEQVLRQLACPAEGCLFIDDHPPNVERARTAGIPALLFSSAERLAADLADLGYELAPANPDGASALGST